MADFSWDIEPVFCFTADVDWASEESLEECHRLFESFGITVTYFMTHPSEVLQNLHDKNAINVGIHPNFLKGSSHGEGFEAVIEYCTTKLPKTECFRSHRYYDVTDITHGLKSKGFKYDSNVCTLLQQNIQPFKHESGLIRFPTFFEDGTYLFNNFPLEKLVIPKIFSQNNLMIISVHPMHMVMNSPNIKYSRNVKDKLTRDEWNNMSGETLIKERFDGRGIRNYVEDLLQFITDNNFLIKTLEELYGEHIGSNSNGIPE
jgi:hypothetical protein